MQHAHRTVARRDRADHDVHRLAGGSGRADGAPAVEHAAHVEHPHAVDPVSAHEEDRPRDPAGPPEPLRRGAPANLVLAWRAEQTVPDRYAVFVHLRDEAREAARAAAAGGLAGAAAGDAQESEMFLSKARDLQKKSMQLTQQQISAVIAEGGGSMGAVMPLDSSRESEAAPPQPAIGLSLASISFGSYQGGSNPASQQVQVNNDGTGTLGGLSASVTYGAGQPSGWLTATLNSSAAPTTLTVQARTGSLSAGTHNAMVSISSAAAGNSPQSARSPGAESRGPGFCPSKVDPEAISDASGRAWDRISNIATS